METTIKKYIAPTIEIVLLDNEISLVLESNPPLGPDEALAHPHYFNNDPFKSETV